MPKLDPDLLARARRVDLISYLHAAGHQPVYAKHTKALFHSPVREDRNPSFTVSFTDGAWKWIDWARGTHGDSIDLVMTMFSIDFQTAVRRLLDLPISQDVPARDESRHQYTPREVQRLYYRWRSGMTPEHDFLIRQYFLSRRLAFPEELGLVYLEVTVNREGMVLPYVGIPSPSAQPRHLTTLECRALNDTECPKQFRRRTFGDKALWVIRRPTPALLVTESILDCLAGNQLLSHRPSLCALNTINNIDRLLECVQQLRPKTVYLALDNDPDKALPTSPAASPQTAKPGQTAQRKACDLLLQAGYRVVEVQHHVHAEVKDLHKLLLKDPTPITFEQVERLGIIYTPSTPRP